MQTLVCKQIHTFNSANACTYIRTSRTSASSETERIPFTVRFVAIFVNIVTRTNGRSKAKRRQQQQQKQQQQHRQRTHAKQMRSRRRQVAWNGKKKHCESVLP